MSDNSSDQDEMVPMNRLSIIRHLQDPAVIGYLQVADTHCWRYGVPRPNLTFHPTTRYALLIYLHRLRHKHLHLHQHVHMSPGTHPRVQVHPTDVYTCLPTVADKCTYLTFLRGSKGGGAKGRSKEKSKRLLEESRSTSQVMCRADDRPEAWIKPLLM